MSITNISHIGTSSQHPCSSGLDPRFLEMGWEVLPSIMTQRPDMEHELRRLIPRTSLGATLTEASHFDPVCIFQTRIF